MLPRVHLQFSDEDLDKVDKYNGKIKVGVRKIVKLFGEFCGASLSISEVIKDKKWKSTWLFLEPEKHSMCHSRNFYWKSAKSGATNLIVVVDPNDSNCNDKAASISNEEEFWIRNDLYNLKKKNADTLHSQSAWLNGRILDAAQKLIYKAPGDKKSYQSVLNSQRNVSIPFGPENYDHIQLLHDGSSHWSLSFCSSG